ncbi:unnamed protein product, partial [Owenia fusiformis]
KIPTTTQNVTTELPNATENVTVEIPTTIRNITEVLTTQNMTIENITEPITAGPVTTEPVTTAPAPTLTTNSTLSFAWVRTVLRIHRDDPEDGDVRTPEFFEKMELRLANAFVKAYDRSEAIKNGTYTPLLSQAEEENLAQRTKRAVKVSDVEVQLVNSTREGGNNVSLVYYHTKNNSIVPTDDAVAVLGLINEHEMILLMGHSVAVVVEPFFPPFPPIDQKLWIIGVVIGSLLVLIGIIWCVMFMYCKMCRPPKTPSSPRPQRLSNSGGDVKPLGSEKNGSQKATQKTALASEAQSFSAPGEKLQNVRGEIPTPVKQRDLKRSPDHGQSRVGRQGQGRVKPRAVERVRKDDDNDSGMTEESYGSQEQLYPSRTNSRHDENKAGMFDHVARMSYVNEKPKEPLHTSTHTIRLPPLVQQPLVGTSSRLGDSFKEQDELNSSLRQKADIEHYRNKQRQRSRKYKKPPATADKIKQRNAYNKAQRDIANILDDPSGKSKKKKKRAHRECGKRGSYDVTAATLSDPGGRYTSSKPAFEEIPSMEDDDVDSGTEHETLQDARFRMHQLLDDAFSMLSPSARHNRVGPHSTSSSPITTSKGPLGSSQMNRSSSARHRRRQRSAHTTPGTSDRESTSNGEKPDRLFSKTNPKLGWGTDQPKEDMGPKHTPLFITPMTKKKDEYGNIMWSPYTAADETSRISPTKEMAYLPGTMGSLKSTPISNQPQNHIPPDQRTPVGPPYKPQAFNQSCNSEPMNQSYQSGPLGQSNNSYSTGPLGQSYNSGPLGQSYNSGPLGQSYNPDTLGQSYKPETSQTYSPKTKSGDDYTSLRMTSQLISPYASGQQIPMTNLRVPSPPERDTGSDSRTHSVHMRPNPLLHQQNSYGFQPIKSDIAESSFNQPTKHGLAKSDDQSEGSKQRTSPIGALSNQSEQRKNVGGAIAEGRDEIDIAQSLKVGNSPQPLVSSIREELLRLSQKAGWSPRSTKIVNFNETT